MPRARSFWASTKDSELSRRWMSWLGTRSFTFVKGVKEGAESEGSVVLGASGAGGVAGAAVAGVVAGLDAGVLIAAIGIVWLLAAAVMLPYPRDAEPVDEPVGT